MCAGNPTKIFNRDTLIIGRSAWERMASESLLARLGKASKPSTSYDACDVGRPARRTVSDDPPTASCEDS
jgi:hypothetical protein